MWTENLQQQTKEHFKQYPLGPMKHFTGKKYGVCMCEDGKYTIANRSNDEVYEYETMEALLADGWAID